MVTACVPRLEGCRAWAEYRAMTIPRLCDGKLFADLGDSPRLLGSIGQVCNNFALYGGPTRLTACVHVQVCSGAADMAGGAVYGDSQPCLSGVSAAAH